MILAAAVVITMSNGGRIDEFVSRAREIKAHHQMLVIDGPCMSACVSMADLARPNVCITQRAVFAYHKSNYWRPIPLSSKLHNWIMRHGGYPDFHGRPAILPRSVAQQHWPSCQKRFSARVAELRAATSSNMRSYFQNAYMPNITSADTAPQRKATT